MKEGILPRATLISTGKAQVEGEPDEYVRGMIRTLRLSVKNLKLYRGYGEGLERGLRFSSRIAGTAYIERDDTFRIAGNRSLVFKEVVFSARTIEADTKYDWQAHIGYIPHDWEIGHDPCFYIEGYIPKSAFDALSSAYLAGHVSELTVDLETTLWVRDSDWYEPPSGRVDWFLLPEFREQQSNMPGGESGTFKSFSWQEEPRIRRPPPLPMG